MGVVQALQIDFVQIHPGADIVKHLGRGISVRHEAGDQPGSLSLAEDLDRPFRGDQRFVIGADHHSGAVTKSQARQLAGGCLPPRGEGVRIADGLRGHPVLAVTAVQVAAEHAEA